MRLFMAMFTVLLLAGCGPKYVTDYDLFPPDTAQGQQCVTECVVQKERCEKICYRDALQCEKFNDYGTYGGGSIGSGGRLGGGVGIGFPLGHSGTRSCNSTGFCEQSCREDQLVCHKNCGGTVSQREPRCVSGCKTNN